jgi:hypothetical protein
MIQTCQKRASTGAPLPFPRPMMNTHDDRITSPNQLLGLVTPVLKGPDQAPEELSDPVGPVGAGGKHRLLPQPGGFEGPAWVR